MSDNATYDRWWKNAVIYCVDVELCCDRDGDVIGDFPGLTSRIDEPLPYKGSATAGWPCPPNRSHMTTAPGRHLTTDAWQA